VKHALLLSCILLAVLPLSPAAAQEESCGHCHEWSTTIDGVTIWSHYMRNEAPRFEEKSQEGFHSGAKDGRCNASHPPCTGGGGPGGPPIRNEEQDQQLAALGLESSIDPDLLVPALASAGRWDLIATLAVQIPRMVEIDLPDSMILTRRCDGVLSSVVRIPQDVEMYSGWVRPS
jgi:hypothetical protein